MLYGALYWPNITEAIQSLQEVQLFCMGVDLITMICHNARTDISSSFRVNTIIGNQPVKIKYKYHLFNKTFNICNTHLDF